MPKLKMMDGTAFDLTEEEAGAVVRDVLAGKQMLGVRGAMLNARSLSGIYPDALVAQESAFGRLHDGSRVMKRFGRWTDPENPDINISLEHYPEIARDQVMSEAMYQKDVAPLELPLRVEAYYRLVGSGEIRHHEPRRRIGGGMEPIAMVAGRKELEETEEARIQRLEQAEREGKDVDWQTGKVTSE